MKIILDPAHGINTSGKRSPDGRLREYEWSREIVNRLSDKLNELGIDNALTVSTEYEPGLRYRVIKTNQLASLVNNDALLISIHCNAAGADGKWHNARGFSIWTSRGQTKSDNYAEIIFNEFEKTFPEIPVRSDTSDGDHDYESNFAVLMCTCPAVLIETLFQDNKEDVELLLSEDFKTGFVECLANSVQLIVNS
jgi:N-acetylmuramoyl-L-alanine amidase